MSLRTLFLSSSALDGGAGWSMYYLIKHLDRRRFDPIVVLPEDGLFGDRYRAIGVPVVAPTRLPQRTSRMRFSHTNAMTTALSYAWNLWDAARFVPELADRLEADRIDLLYCNNMNVKTVGAMAARRHGTPCVFHVRNVHEHPGKVFLYGRTLARLPYVKRIIAVSDAAAAPYRRYAPEKVEVIRNGVELAAFDPAVVPRGGLRRDLGLPDTAVIVGFTGQLIPRKGVDVLIRAVATLLPARPHLHLVLLGLPPTGSAVDYLAEYTRLAASLGAGGRVHFAGFRDDVRPAVVDFDLLALPAWQDPFPRSVIEAMALGRPVVASAVGGIPEIVEDGVHGRLVGPGDVASLADAIADLVDSEERRRTMGAAARVRALDRCDVAALTRRIEGVLAAAAAA
ncbi:MAG: glycosyltransferase family 4 protein [Vicinamibacterales bacterium]